MTQLFNRYNQLLQSPELMRSHDYREGDMVVIDNLAVAHRASPEAHYEAGTQGLRVLHRTTVAGMVPLDPPEKFGLPAFLPVYAGGMVHNPFGPGVFEFGSVGFRWDPNIRMQN